MHDLNEQIRDLSEIYDKDSQNTYVTLYNNRDENEKYLERREKACKSLLSGKELKNFIITIKEIKEFLNRNLGSNYAIFASNKHNYFNDIYLPIKVKNSLIVDSSPYIRPLARIQDEWESFTLAIVNSKYAKISSISLGKVEKEKNLSADIINKHKKGGWSQARFQRLRKGAINAFLKEVAGALERNAEKQIIIAGPGKIKLKLRDMLPKNLKEKIVKVIDININDENELLKESINFISKLEEEKSKGIVKSLKKEILKDGLASYGFNDTLNAVKKGQVELLIIEKDYRIKGHICEKCQLLKAGTVKKCPNCNSSTSEVDIIEEILEFAKRTDALIEFTNDEEISKLGHIGAILRYK